MSTPTPTPTYPVAYFLHSPHATPKTLQPALATPTLLKLRKAWLPGYLPAPNSTVSTSSTRMGDWEDEDEIRGFVYYVIDMEQERKLKEHVGGGCEVKEVDFEVCVGGVFGVREWERGRAFVVSEEDIGGEDEMRAQDMVDTSQLNSASKKEKRKALLRRITEPLGLRSMLSAASTDEQASVRKAPGLFRHIISSMSQPVGEPEPTCHQDTVVSEDLLPHSASRPQITVAGTSLLHVEDKPNIGAPGVTTSDEEVPQDVVADVGGLDLLGEVEKIEAVQKIEVVEVEKAVGTEETDKIQEIGKPELEDELKDGLEHPSGV